VAAWTAEGSVPLPDTMKLKQLTESQKKSLPRKPRSAYMMFCNQRRPQLSAMEQYSTVPAKDKMATFSRIMSREWRELPERVKKDYAAQAQLDRYERYGKLELMTELYNHHQSRH